MEEQLFLDFVERILVNMQLTGLGGEFPEKVHKALNESRFIGKPTFELMVLVNELLEKKLELHKMGTEDIIMQAESFLLSQQVCKQMKS